MKKNAFYYFQYCHFLVYLMWCNGLLSGPCISYQKRPAEPSPNQKLLVLTRGSFRGSLEQVEDLLKSGADCNVQDVNGASPLHHAAIKCNVPLAILLLRYGAKPELKDKARHSPRDIVCTSCFERQKSLFLAELDKERSTE